MDNEITLQHVADKIAQICEPETVANVMAELDFWAGLASEYKEPASILQEAIQDSAIKLGSDRYQEIVGLFNSRWIYLIGKYGKRYGQR